MLGRAMPKFEVVDPRDLYVEEDYQRESENAGSIKLIREIYAGFSWARFKPPICVRLPETGNILVCIDGQHTATGAATRPDVKKIPVLVVPPESVEGLKERARSFVGHNRVRLNLSQISIFKAELAADDAVAMGVAKALKHAGVVIPEYVPSYASAAKPGTTVAIGAMRRIVDKYGVDMLASVLKLLVAAKRAPLRADEIAACVRILSDIPDCYDALAKAVASKSAAEWSAIAMVGLQSKEGRAFAIARVWCREIDVRLVSHWPNARVALQRAGPAPAPAQAAQPEPKPAPAPKPVPKPDRMPQPPAKAPRVGDMSNIIVRNGITVDLEYDRVRTGRHDWVALGADAAHIVAALLKVMPSFLPSDRLARQLHVDAFLLHQISMEANAALKPLRLEVKPIPKMGYALADLDAAAA